MIRADERGLTTLEYVIAAGIILVVLAAGILALNNGLAAKIGDLVRQLSGSWTATERAAGARQRLRGEAGAAAVEAVLVVPLVLIPVLFAVFIFGRLAHTRIVLDAAAAAGARQRLRSPAQTRQPSAAASRPSCATERLNAPTSA